MSAATQPTAQTILRDMDELRARTHWEPLHGFMWLVCPSCGSDDLITQPRLAGHTHRDFTKCGSCRDIVGWDFQQDKQIRDLLIALGAPLVERAA